MLLICLVFKGPREDHLFQDVALSYVYFNLQIEYLKFFPLLSSIFANTLKATTSWLLYVLFFILATKDVTKKL